MRLCLIGDKEIDSTEIREVKLKIKIGVLESEDSLVYHKRR